MPELSRSPARAVAADQAVETSAAAPESATETEELVGNASSIDAMMEAEPDESSGADGGGILAALLTDEEEASGPEDGAVEDAGPALDPVDVGRVEDGAVVDFRGRRVEKGGRVVYLEQVWQVHTIQIDPRGEDFTIDVERPGEDETIDDEDAFAVTDAAVEEGPLGLARAAPRGLKRPDRRDISDQERATSLGNARSIKVRKWTDDVYMERGVADAAGPRGRDKLARKMLPGSMRAKTWEKDAAGEFEALKGAEIAKKAPKYRKMMVRAVERLDAYALEIETSRALTEATYAETFAEWQAADQAGDVDTSDEHADSLATLKKFKDSLEDASPKVQGDADKTHERSHEVVRWSDQVALQDSSDAAAMLDRLAGGDLGEKEPEYTGWVHEALKDRTSGKKAANDAYAVKKGITDGAVFGTRKKGWFARRKKTMSDSVSSGVASGKEHGKLGWAHALGYLSGGLVSVDSREVDGGKSTKKGVDFNTWKTNFRKVKAECAQIEDGALYGEHTGLYTTLKMLTDFGIPTLQGVLKALILWGGILALATLGAGIALSAAAGTISLVLTGLKGVLEVVLALWSHKKAVDYTDRDARKARLAKAERWRHGKAAVVDATSAATMSVASTTKGGKSLSPKEAARKRFTDFDNSGERQYGAVGTGKARKALGIGSGTLLDSDASAIKGRAAGTAVDKSIDGLGSATGATGHGAEEERDRRLDPEAGAGSTRGISADDRFFSASPLAGPAPDGPAPAAPDSAGPAPSGPAPLPPSAASADAGSTDADQAQAEGSKVKRMASKIASGLASAADTARGAVSDAKDKDPEAGQKASDVTDIAADAAEVAAALP